MATFTYRAFGIGGDLAEGTVEGASAGAVEAALLARGLTPFEVTEQAARGAGGFGRPALRGRGRLSAQALVSFTRDLAMLREADVPLDASLRVLASQGSPAQRGLADGVLADVLDGRALSDALAKRGDIFAAEYVNAVKAGEATGKSGVVLRQMAEVLARRADLSGKIRTALVYPALLVVLALAATAVVILVLVPSIAPIFTDAGKPLPGGLRFIMALSAAWPVWGAGLFALGLGAAAGGERIRRDAGFKRSVDEVTLRVPWLGSWLAQYESARFARTLGFLITAGVPLMPAFSSAESSVGNLAMRRPLTEAADKVGDGWSLSRALAHVERMPRVIIDMLAVGEEAGRPGEMLLSVAHMLERQSEQRMERAMALLTPLLTLLIAAVVGSLIMTVMTAVLSINDLATL